MRKILWLALVIFLAPLICRAQYAPAQIWYNPVDGSFHGVANLVDTKLTAGTSAFVYTGVLAGIPATCAVGQVAFITDATAGQNLYYCTSTNTFTQQLNSGSSGASTALSNLSSVAVNLALLPGSDASISLDSASKRYVNFYASGIYGWTNGSGTGDTGLSRDAAGIIDAGNGTAGNTSGGFKAASYTTTGANGGDTCTEGTGAGLTAASGVDLMWCDSSAHRWKVNPNNAGATTLAEFADNLSVFASTTSAQLAGVISDGTGSGSLVFGTAPTFSTSITTPKIITTTNCAAAGTGANPSVVSCSAAPSGAFSCATNASTGTCTVDTSIVTTNSNIFIQPTGSTVVGTRLSVTCNTSSDTGLTGPRLAAIVNGTSFTINLGTFSTNPLCFMYDIFN